MNLLVDDFTRVQALAESKSRVLSATNSVTPAVLAAPAGKANAASLPVHSEAQVAELWRESKQVVNASQPRNKEHSTQGDQHLVSRAVTGDKRAFDLLVLKYQSRIARLIAVYVKDADNVQDVLQETFIRAYKALKQYRSESQFYTWLYRIAVNTSFSFLKANKTWQQKFEAIEEGEDFHEPAAHIDEPDSVIHNQHLNVAIKSAFDALPLKLRTTLALRELDGMSYEDIATVTEVDLGTVKSRLSRARARVIAKTEPLYRQQDCEPDFDLEAREALV